MNNEPYIISIKEAKWLMSALMEGSRRPVLNHAAIVHWDGCAVLATTDTYRLHVLRLSKAEPFDSQMLDIRRVVYDAAYIDATHVGIARDFTSCNIGRDGSGGIHRSFEPVLTPVFNQAQGLFPDIARFIPETRRPVSEFFAIDDRFLTEATVLAVENAHKIVMYSEDARRMPIAFQNPESDRWIAVIMPMVIEGWETI